MIIDNEEFQKRISLLQEILLRQDLEAILIFSTESEPAGVRYLSDYWPSFETAAVLVPKTGKPALLIGPESMIFAKSHSKIEDIISMKDFRESSMPDYPGTQLINWKELLYSRKVRNIGIAGWHLLPHTIYRNISDVIGSENIWDADELIRKLTIRKTSAELACLREAARISELGFKAVLNQIQPGMTEVQLVGIATAAMLANGAESTGYPIWCCSGPNSSNAISRPTHRKVQKGEIIHFSIGAKVAGYSASIGRPIVLGQCPPETLRFMQVGLDAENLAINLMQAGVEAASVAKEVYNFIDGKGYGDAILYGPAHGCGQMECEYPFVETSSDFVLDRGMVFMVDIFLARHNIGFRWEDGIIITEGKAEQLSNYKRKINII